MAGHIDGIVDNLQKSYRENGIKGVERLVEQSQGLGLSTVEGLRAAGAELVKSADYEAALPLFIAIKAARPDDHKAHYQLGTVYLRMGEESCERNSLLLAQAAFNDAFRLNPSDENYLYAYFKACELLEDYQAIVAKVIYEGIAEELLTARTFTLLAIGYGYRDKKDNDAAISDWDTAREYFKRALESEPDNPSHYANIAESYAAQGNIDEAYRYLRLAKEKSLAMEEQESLELISANNVVRDSLKIGIAHGSYRCIEHDQKFQEIKKFYGIVDDEPSSRSRLGILTQKEVDEILDAVKIMETLKNHGNIK